MSSKILNGNLVRYTEKETGYEMSAIISHGKIEEAVIRELEDDLVKKWNRKQRRVAMLNRAKKFNNENTVYIRTNLNKHTDADILEHLEKLTIPKAKYIKELIRRDMEGYN